MPPELVLDPQSLDFSRVLADREAVAAVNPHRHEMALVDAVVYLDVDKSVVAGYLDVTGDEFWCRGHFPGFPIMPGVLMCEAAAQLCAYYITSQRVFLQDLVALGGLENARFRAPVKPGDRLVMVAKATRLNRRQSVFNVQGFVGGVMTFNVDVIGMPMSLKGS